MKKVIFRAPILSISGYGQHSRQIFKYLLSVPNIELSTQVLQWGATPWLINPDNENGLVGEAMKRTIAPTEKADVSLQLQLPDEWSPDLANVNIGMTAGVETDKCSNKWIDSINKMSHIIVPSTHVLNTFNNSGNVKTKIDVVPESFIEEIVTTDNIFPEKFKTKFNFLIISQITSPYPGADRKNTYTAIKSIAETFRNDDTVGIILKANSGRGTTFDRINTVNIVNEWLKEIRKISNVPVYLIHGNMSNVEMASIYRHPSVRALVSLTRGEGFGLPLVEAAAAGVPIIATNWSGHLDFLSLGNFIKINYKLSKIPDNKIDERIFIKDAMWAEPDIDDFIRKIKKFRTTHTDVRKSVIELADICKRRFSQKAIEQSYHNILGEYLK